MPFQQAVNQPVLASAMIAAPRQMTNIDNPDDFFWGFWEFFCLNQDLQDFDCLNCDLCDWCDFSDCFHS